MVSILSIILGTVGAAFFQSVSTQRTIVDDGLAINEARKGLSWFAPDVRMAQHAEVGDQGNTLTLAWTDDFVGDGAPGPLVCHTSEYARNGESLNRTYDGTTHTIARRVAAVDFTRRAGAPRDGQHRHHRVGSGDRAWYHRDCVHDYLHDVQTQRNTDLLPVSRPR